MNRKHVLALAIVMIALTPSVGGCTVDGKPTPVVTAPPEDGSSSNGTFMAQGRAVEGHTSFVHLTPDSTRTVDVVGDLACHVEIRGVLLAVPPGVAGTVLDCMAGATVIVHGAGSPDPLDHELQPTMDRTHHTDPNGVMWTATRYTYTAPDPGTGDVETYSAWAVPAAGPYEDPETGEPYRFAMELDESTIEGDAVHVVTTRGPVVS